MTKITVFEKDGTVNDWSDAVAICDDDESMALVCRTQESQSLREAMTDEPESFGYGLNYPDREIYLWDVDRIEFEYHMESPKYLRASGDDGEWVVPHGDGHDEWAGVDGSVYWKDGTETNYERVKWYFFESCPLLQIGIDNICLWQVNKIVLKYDYQGP